MANLLSRYLVPGRQIDLQAVERSSVKRKRGEKKVHQSQVLDVLSEDRFEISMPMEEGKLILLPVDGEYNLYIHGEGVLYQCYARVVDRYKNHNRYVLVMDLLSNLRKYQRREYYRFSCALEMDSRQLEEEETSLMDKEEESMTPELPLKRSVIVDISGGGLRFVANYSYEVDSLILCKYRLMVEGEIKEFNLVGKVLNVKEVENSEGLFEHRVQYVNMTAGDREKIIKYIFDEERKTLKNTKGDLGFHR